VCAWDGIKVIFFSILYMNFYFGSVWLFYRDEKIKDTESENDMFFYSLCFENL
jgi:hypothetical protein